ncbi:aminopeptidase [bacterium]|nr:aminopeptidase [bacterium]
MLDPRVRKLAELLVDYSARVKKNDICFATAIGAESLPLLRELQRACLSRGAAMFDYEYLDVEMQKDFYDGATKEQIAYFPQHKLDLMKQVDCYFAVRAAENSMVFANANQKALAARQRVLAPILNERVDNTRWVVTIFPTHGFAQEAGMSKTEFEDFYFGAVLYDYEELQRHQARLARLMNVTDKVRIVASDTDITLSIKNIPTISCFGDRNIPDGECFTAPVRDSANGYVTFNTPSIYQGREFANVKLTFKNGKIVDATCAGKTAELNEVFDTDEGARYLGEFAVGTNPKIRRPMRNILFDEKIYGSVHITPGRAYNEADNGNRSSIHWDMVKILTGDGDMFFDGVLVQHNGVFVHEELLDLNPAPERKIAEQYLASRAAKVKKTMPAAKIPAAAKAKPAAPKPSSKKTGAKAKAGAKEKTPAKKRAR